MFTLAFSQAAQRSVSKLDLRYRYSDKVNYATAYAVFRAKFRNTRCKYLVTSCRAQTRYLAKKL